MKGFESGAGARIPSAESPIPSATADDFADAPELHAALKRLPEELQGVHATRMSDMDDEEALAYITAIHEKRESAVRESVVSDEGIKAYFESHEEEIWKHLETDVFSDTDNFLGRGQTARIKRFELHDADGEAVPAAIKYLVSPTEKTLSVSGEHDLIREVERVRAIELAEQVHEGRVPHIRVPHPYFYYKKGKTQCYGMELIDGINLEQGIAGEYGDDMRAELRAALTGIDRHALSEELRLFFGTMHEICLHGDIKPANIMVNRSGQFYVIDFGQSFLVNDVNDTARDALEVLKEDDVKNAENAIRHFLNALEA